MWLVEFRAIKDLINIVTPPAECVWVSTEISFHSAAVCCELHLNYF